MGGVVFAPGTGVNPLGRYGNPITLAAAAVIPAGVYFVSGGYTIVGTNGTSYAFEAGLCVSDGVNCTSTAAGVAIPLGD